MCKAIEEMENKAKQEAKIETIFDIVKNLMDTYDYQRINNKNIIVLKKKF